MSDAFSGLPPLLDAACHLCESLAVNEAAGREAGQAVQEARQRAAKAAEVAESAQVRGRARGWEG